METLLLWDEDVFLWINGLSIPLFEDIAAYYRHKLFWVPVYVFLLAYLFVNFRRQAVMAVAFALITVGIADTASSQWIKKSVQRPRPCHLAQLQQEMTLRIRCGGGYSFTSSHATNHAAVASYFFLMLGSLRRRRWHWLLPIWAVSIALSQVYVGVHYPLDILAGLILGSCIGWLTSTVFKRYFPLTAKSEISTNSDPKLDLPDD